MLHIEEIKSLDKLDRLLSALASFTGKNPEQLDTVLQNYIT